MYNKAYYFYSVLYYVIAVMLYVVAMMWVYDGRAEPLTPDQKMGILLFGALFLFCVVAPVSEAAEVRKRLVRAILEE